MSLSNNPVNRFDTLPRHCSIEHWHKIFGTVPPLRVGIGLLAAIITQAQQESTITSSFRTLEKQLQPWTTKPSSLGGRLKARFQIGDRIVRGWGGRNHEVTVLPKGFSYRGEIYPSLSEIARRITGARWSGPRFFGTREKSV